MSSRRRRTREPWTNVTSPPDLPHPAGEGKSTADEPSARATPYELALGTEEIEGRLFPAIRAEVASRDADAADPQAFVMLGEVGVVLRDLLVPGADASPGSMVRQAGRLLYHGYHFWQAERPLLVAGRELVRRLVGPEQPFGADVLAAPLVAPAPAGYMQLPRHLFWGRIEGGAVPEPVDGFFWTVAASEAGAVRHLEVLLALGVRPGRPGFSVIEASGDAPAGAGPGWAGSAARPQGRDFENVLPGGELEGLYSVTTIGEVLKLVELLFRHAASTGLEPQQTPSESLPYRRLRLG